MICLKCNNTLPEHSAFCLYCGTKISHEPRAEHTTSVGQFEWEVLDTGTVIIKKYTGTDENVNIPEKIEGKCVTAIGCEAFKECYSLKSIIIPNSVTEIGNGAFMKCTSLISITLSDSLTGIADGLFLNCISLSSITIPHSVTRIGLCAFGRCYSLTHINILDGVTKIECGAFAECSSLTSINLPDSIREIGCRSFENCTSLVSINIPESVTSVDKDAFFGCTSLPLTDVFRQNVDEKPIDNSPPKQEISVNTDVRINSTNAAANGGIIRINGCGIAAELPRDVSTFVIEANYKLVVIN